MRAGGEKRGNTEDRRRRRVWLLANHDVDLGPDKARCALRLSGHCHEVVTIDDLTVDRVDPGGTYAHENIRPACGPCQNVQGALITHERRHQWKAWKEEADALGIEWTG